MRPTAHYVITLFSTLAGLAALVAGLAIAVDPYRRFGTPPIAGLTVEKPAAYDQGAMAKTYALERVALRSVILGNSRSEIGLNPESVEWPANLRPVFNASAAGSGLAYSTAMLQHILALHGPVMVVLALDFRDFLHDPGSIGGSTRDRLLVRADGRPNPRRGTQMLLDALAATLTIDALTASLRTLTGQEPAYSVTMTDLGFNPLRDYHAHVRSSGHDALFDQNLRTARRLIARFPVQQRFDDQRSSIKALQQFMKIASDRGAPLRIFVHPLHARYLDMLLETGFWPAFEDWKRALAAAINQYRDSGADIELIDFSGYDRYATESVPPPGDTRTHMRWWWEAGHYKAALGDQIIGRLFGENREWGVALDAATINEHLTRKAVEHTLHLEEKRLGSLATKP